MTWRYGTNVAPSERLSIAWYAPRVLLQSGRQLLSSADFQRNYDRRESFPERLQPIDMTDKTDANGCFGFDFISDTGDGGNATTTVAEGAMRDVLVAEDGPPAGLPRGRLLVLGGDLAYPAASPDSYQYRFVEPYELCRPLSALPPNRPWHTVLAIPQNHDWMDNASTFCRYFVGRTGEPFVDAGGTRTRRSPSSSVCSMRSTPTSTRSRSRRALLRTASDRCIPSSSRTDCSSGFMQ
jgi:hypothetical protein